MPAYASIDDVQARMPQFTLTCDTRPNLSTAQVMLDDTQAQFDAVLMTLGYVIPLTGRLSLAQAKEIVSQGTICKILNARGAAVGTDAAFQSADRACKRYEDALLALADPNSVLGLPDAEGGPGERVGTTPMGLYPQCPRFTMRDIW